MKRTNVTTDLDSAPAYRVDLVKRTNTYFVIADDECTLDPRRWDPEFVEYRDILLVERAAANSEEQALQEETLSDECFHAQSPLHFLTFTAVSHAQAAGLARRAYFEQRVIEEAEYSLHADERAFWSIIRTL